MCINFHGHHSGGSSFYMYMRFDYVIRCGPYPQVPVWFKKNQVKSPSPESRTLNSVRIRQSGRDTPTLRVVVGASSSVSSSESPKLPNFALGSGMGRRCYTCSSTSNIRTSAS